MNRNTSEGDRPRYSQLRTIRRRVDVLRERSDQRSGHQSLTGIAFVSVVALWTLRSWGTIGSPCACRTRNALRARGACRALSAGGCLRPHGNLRLRPRPAERSTPEVIVTLSSALEVVSRGVSGSFADTHPRLERQGLLDHPVAGCPSRAAAVRIWTPEGGWQAVH